MAWRVIAHGNEVWHVDALAERRAHTEAWQLVLTFRAASDRLRTAPFLTPFPLEATSKTSLLIQADRIKDRDLSRLLEELLS